MITHSWQEGAEKGYLRCEKCGLVVKSYKVKRGGLPPCKPKINFIESKEFVIRCPECEKLVPNTIFCINCSKQLHPLNWRRE